ncbi:helix-turn-helix transcriptional regulator [Clostridium sp. MB40-C1]|uniref:helix-turn-helix domain-containing protein n=1 Tax=Clostridium sp. MB40-C1 TaxID=3070996 RepID=UPI0027E06549|nr:helix-turn-helix transcriptional regulator [Clostridium sp. MB40-C1]WMJ81248.1 helix-turn-helix transcriptional regulator [Clostridium sp. MB40-C1]
MLSCNEVKNLMLMKDITQTEICEYCGVKRPYISMLINGKQPFTEEIYNKMIEYINLSIKDKEKFRNELKEKKEKEKQSKQNKK